MSEESLKKELVRELETDGNSYFRSGVLNNVSDITLTVATVIASLVAAGLASSEQRYVGRWVFATIAAVPAAAASLQKIIGMRQRADWYFLYAAKVRALTTRLKFSPTAEVEEIAELRAKLEVEMEMGWSSIGGSATSHVNRRGKNGSNGE